MPPWLRTLLFPLMILQLDCGILEFMVTMVIPTQSLPLLVLVSKREYITGFIQLVLAKLNFMQNLLAKISALELLMEPAPVVTAIALLDILVLDAKEVRIT